MAFKILTIKFDSEKELFIDEEIDKFLINKKLKSYEVRFFSEKNSHYWTLFIEYDEIIDKKNRTPEVIKLTDEEKHFLLRLKELRKNLADKNGVPVYVVATNKELLGVVKNKPKTLESLKNIDGFGKRKLEKYGKDLIQLVNNYYSSEDSNEG